MATAVKRLFSALKTTRFLEGDKVIGFLCAKLKRSLYSKCFSKKFHEVSLCSVVWFICSASRNANMIRDNRASRGKKLRCFYWFLVHASSPRKTTNQLIGHSFYNPCAICDTKALHRFIGRVAICLPSFSNQNALFCNVVSPSPASIMNRNCSMAFFSSSIFSCETRSEGKSFFYSIFSRAVQRFPIMSLIKCEPLMSKMLRPSRPSVDFRWNLSQSRWESTWS